MNLILQLEDKQSLMEEQRLVKKCKTTFNYQNDKL